MEEMRNILRQAMPKTVATLIATLVISLVTFAWFMYSPKTAVVVAIASAVILVLLVLLWLRRPAKEQLKEPTVSAVTFAFYGGDEGRRGQRELRPPAAPGKLFGREEELERVVAALERGRSTLIYGMAGIGKTALAGETAAKLDAKRRFTDGILWLSAIGDAPLEILCDRVAHACGDEKARKLSSAEKPDHVRNLLATHHLLIVLDDVVKEVTAHGFLRSCLPQGIPLLVTSRYHHWGFAEEVSLQPLHRRDAAELFRARVQIGEGQDGVVEEICNLLGDHPLAIVVAAGRVRHEKMPLERLQARLQDEKARLRSLKLGEEKDVNVWTSLNISFEPLSEKERLVFTHLAACFGETAGLELLAGACRLGARECEDLLGQLVTRSLVEQEDGRFRLHQLVRDFGRDVLGKTLTIVQGQVAAAALAYAQRYAELRPEHFDALRTEFANILSGMTWYYTSKKWGVVREYARHIMGFLASYDRNELALRCAQAMDAGIRAVIISGGAGIGKTWLANEVATFYKKDEAMNVLWIHCHALQSWADPLSLIVQGVDLHRTSVAQENMLRTLEEQQYLIIFDGVDQIHERWKGKFVRFLEEFFERFQQTKVVITSNSHFGMKDSQSLD